MLTRVVLNSWTQICLLTPIFKVHILQRKGKSADVSELVLFKEIATAALFFSNYHSDQPLAINKRPYNQQKKEKDCNWIKAQMTVSMF
jgi:hypothetical protein